MYQYDWLPGSLVQPDQLEQFSALYSEHYGIWGQNGPKPGQHVRLSPDRLRKWLTPDTSVFWASALDKLVGYAIAVRTKIPGGGVVAWVTQLVVHEDHRKQDVGKTLLFSIWRFSDFFAWALLSANPYAVRALEKATRRRCLPPRIASSVKELVHLGYAAIPYLPPDVGVVATAEEARIDTRFFLDHSQLSMMLSSVVSKGNPWSLGELPEGWEWFAFTFRDQPQISLTQREIVVMLAASDAVFTDAHYFILSSVGQICRRRSWVHGRELSYPKRRSRCRFRMWSRSAQFRTSQPRGPCHRSRLRALLCERRQVKSR
jgi:GNAT superfamily N-acetyltransferase